jgi:hypothetical protein
MSAIDFPALNPSFLDIFGSVSVEYDPVSGPAFTALAIEARPRNVDDLDPRRASFWFNLPADLSTAVVGRDLQVRPQTGDGLVIASVNYVVVNVHPDGCGGVYLTLEAQ